MNNPFGIPYQQRQEHFKDNSFSYNNEENDENLLNLINNVFNEEKQIDEEGENLLLEENSQDIYLLNSKQNKKFNSIQINIGADKKTKPTTLTNLIKVNEVIIKEFSIQIKNEDNTNYIQPRITQTFLKKKRGRKKTKENNIESKHDKDSEDNKMRKIKTHLMEHIVYKLNESQENKKNKFYKINSFLSENLKKEYNEKLMKRTLYDIFRNEKMSNKYRKKKNDNLNIILIDKIYKEKIEIKTIELLEKTYIDIVNEIQKNELNEFFEKIKAKELGNRGKNIDIYINSLIELFKDFENWFKNKKGRSSRKAKIKK